MDTVIGGTILSDCIRRQLTCHKYGSRQFVVTDTGDLVCPDCLLIYNVLCKLSEEGKEKILKVVGTIPTPQTVQEVEKVEIALQKESTELPERVKNIDEEGTSTVQLNKQELKFLKK